MRKSKEGKNLSLVIFFISLVFGIVVIYFLWQFFRIYSQSTFDGTNQYILKVENDSSFAVAVFSPDTKTISIVSVKPYNKSTSLQRTLLVPLDSSITVANSGSIEGIIRDLPFEKEISSTHLTIIDKFRLWFFALTLPFNAISSYTLDANNPDLSLVQKLFLDKNLYQDSQTVAVVNTTTVPGLGGEFSRLLTNIGVDVISVTSGESIQETSKILYSGDQSYTVKRMHAVFGIPTRKSQLSPVADITLIIGKDKANLF